MEVLRLLCEDLDPVVAPLRIGIVVVAKAHILGGGVHDIDTVAFRSHPVCNDLFGRGLAPGGILAGGGIRHTVLLQHGEAVGAIGAGVGSDLCHFLCALIGGGLQLGIAHARGARFSFARSALTSASTSCAKPFSLVPRA